MRNNSEKIYLSILLCCILSHFLFSQTPLDSTSQTAKDTNAVQSQSPLSTSTIKDSLQTVEPVQTPAATITEQNSFVAISFIKQKYEHSPDSVFFNILSITNRNSLPIQGVIKFTAPVGWKIISGTEVNVVIQPGVTEFIPIRVSLARTAIGGVSYLVTALFQSDRSLFPDKNQTSISKSCYIIIPEKKQWDMYPVSRNIYLDRYTLFAPLQIKLSNKGNGSEVVKLEFDIGNSLLMFGTLGKKHFASVELKPHRDTILNYTVKYLPPDESSLWDRDFKKLTVRIVATVDSVVKSASVRYKYLESVHNNALPGSATPLNLEVQLQNLVSNVEPRLLIAADGMIIRKNFDEITYNARITGMPFSGYDNAAELGNMAWRRSRFVVGYTSGDKWQIKGGDVNTSNIGFIGNFGRGLSGWYKLNDKNRFGGAVTASVFSPLYSANAYHNTVLPLGITLGSSLSAIIDNYNKMNTYGAAVQLMYPLIPGHTFGLMLSGSLTQHMYDDQTFSIPGGFRKTDDPNSNRIGMGTQLQYRLSKKRVSAAMNLLFSNKDFFQYYSGRVNFSANGRYTINDRHYVVASSNVVFQDPKQYNQGLLFPQNKFTSGIHRIEGAKIISNKITLFAGPALDHFSYRSLRVNRAFGDSAFTEFATLSPKLSFRCNYKNNASGFITPYVYLGYTFVTHAIDSFVNPIVNPNKSFFNAKAGVNIIQKNWGVNVFYFYGPNSLITQSDNYYFGRYSKSVRIMPYFQKYYWNKQMLLSSYNSYFYEALSNNERIALNGRVTFFLGKSWSMFVDNNLYMSSVVNSEGEKVQTRNFFLSLGVRKAFDIPQPGIKYYDIKVVCFKDINGNKIMDFNEHGLKDIVIGIDRHISVDTIAKRLSKARGVFNPAEMATDEFGYVMYYNIPQGDYDLGIYPLTNLVDVFNVNGQRQTITINRDSTYYIPFVKTYKVLGKIILNRDEYSSLGAISTGSIRITATDSLGNSYFGLTNSDGSYVLFVPSAGEYDVTVNNIFGEQFEIQQSQYKVSFDGAKEFNVDFIFDEKKRKLNINGVTSTSDALLTPQNAADTKQDETSDATPKVVYKVQIATSRTQIPSLQYATRFKGIDNIISEYIDGDYKYTSGEEFTDIAKATEYKNKIIALGYKGAFVATFRDGKRVK